MIQFLFCLFLLIPVVVLPAVVLAVSVPLGIAAVVLSAILAIPLLLAAYGHLDVLRAKSQFDLTDQELDEFVHLVPRLAARPEFSRLRRRELRRSTRLAAAEMIRERRGQSNAPQGERG